jgi:T4-like virus tail tube protein gp19
MANISDFKAQLTGGGARANQFRVELSFPSFVTLGLVAGLQAQFLCNAAQLPASTIEPISILYRGRPVNFAGERTFAPWTIAVYNDTNFNIRNALEQWSNGIQNNGTTNGITNPANYQVDLSVYQLDRNGATVKAYKFVDAFPSEIGDIQLGYDQGNAIETFNVTFQYNYWTSNTSTGAGSGFSLNGTINTPVGSFPI